MSFLRPEVAATLRRWRAVIAAAAIGALALWLAARGGLFYLTLAALAGLAAAGLGLDGWRRARFARARLDPGVVQVVEGQVAYFGPMSGGVAAVRDIVELRLLTTSDGSQTWVLTAETGTRLAIPVAARGAEALHDAFAALPGIDMGRAARALARPRTGAQMIWTRRTAPALT